MSLQDSLILLLSIFIVAAVPGPSDLMVISRTLRHGMHDAMKVAVGVILADVLFILMAVTGMAALASLPAMLQAILGLMIAAALLLMGVALWRHRPGLPVTPRHYDSALIGGFLITLADPKAILFYMGILPGFIDMQHAPARDIGLIIVLVSAVIFGVKGGYALLAKSLQRQLQQGRGIIILYKTAGLLLIGYGIRAAYLATVSV